MKFNRVLMTIAVSFILVLPVNSHATNGYAMHGIGMKSKALAGSGSALPQDSMVVAMNPAGLVHVSKRFELGLAVFSPLREYDVSGFPSGAPGSFGLAPRSVESNSNYFLIPDGGYANAIDSQSSWGVAAFGNGGMNTNYPSFSNAFCPPGTLGKGAFCSGNAGIDLKQLFITPTYARKFGVLNGSWGISLVAVAQLFEAEGLDAFGDFGFSSRPEDLTGNGADLSTGLGVRIGAMAEFVPGLSGSFSYQPKINMSDFNDYAGLFAGGGNFDIPPNWNLGLAWKINGSSALTFDIQHIRFSDVDSVGNSVTQLTQKGNLFGSNDGPGFGWDNMTIYKLGYQWAMEGLPGWTWRVGASHTEQPVPDEEVTLNILAPAVVETHFTAGFTKAMENNNEFSFSFMYAPSKSVKGKNAFDPGQDVEIEMSQYEVELGYSWIF